MDLALFDEDALGAAIQHKALRCSGLPGGDGSSGGEAGDDRTAILPGGIDAVVGTNDRPGAVCDQELHAGQRLPVCAFDELFQDEGRLWLVVKIERLGVVGVDHHRLGPGGLVDGVPWNRGGFRCYNSANHP